LASWRHLRHAVKQRAARRNAPRDSLARHVADGGYHVHIHDRRNCGLSDIAIGADTSEYWAEDLYDLLSQLKALPAVVGGGSSGCRLSVLFALKYPR
jgi:pimeloyl-ACP methyl ester carboxylesterase